MLASQLPDGRDDALAVLDCVRELIETFLRSEEPAPAAKAKVLSLIRAKKFEPEAKQSPSVHAGGVFSAGCSLGVFLIWTLRIPSRPRTALTVRLSLSAIIVMLFPAPAISLSCRSSSSAHWRLAVFAVSIISRRAIPAQAFQWAG